jgi:hypothetical protein
MEDWIAEVTSDAALESVRSFLARKPNLGPIVGDALRKAFDEIIDGARTGRYRIEHLEKTEKTYIGTKVEIVLRAELELQRGVRLDNLICGSEVDTKFSIDGKWMIPREAIGEICLLVSGNDNSGTFNVGLLRTVPAVLTPGSNQDGKRNVSAAGRAQIVWLLRNEALPRNFLLDIDEELRAAILAPKSGSGRLRSLFTLVTGQLIPRSGILQVAQLQGDPLKRARELKAPMLNDGYQVLCAAYEQDRTEFRRHGFNIFKDDDWLSIKIVN